MAQSPYLPPVNRLLTRGEDASVRSKAWADYRTLGIGAEHVPALIRMATDEELLWADGDSLWVWAPLHAWRALGQLRAAEAVEPLLGLLHFIDDNQDDWIGEELPRVFALIGVPAVGPVGSYLADRSHGQEARVTVADALGEIGRAHPECRDDCVAILTRELARLDREQPVVNATCVSSLVDLGALESAAVMERAFAAHVVDLSLMGDWEEVQIELDLLTERLTPPPKRGWLFAGTGDTDLERAEETDQPTPGPADPHEVAELKRRLAASQGKLAVARADLAHHLAAHAAELAREKAKAKRKTAKKARRRNRRR